MNSSGDMQHIKKETEIVVHDGFQSKTCEAQDIQSVHEHLQNKSPALSSPDTCRVSQVVGNKDDSHTNSNDEKEGKNIKLKKATVSKCADETGSFLKKDKRNLKTRRSVSASKNVNNTSGVAGPVLYRCINCSYTDAHLEKLSSHVLACVRKHKQEQNQESGLIGEPPSKARVLDQRFVLPKTEFTTSKTQSIVSPHTEVPVMPKTQYIIAPQTQFVTSPQVCIATTPKVQLINSSKLAQIVMSSTTQQKGINKPAFAVAPKLVSTKNNQVLINPQTQRHVASQPQTSVSQPQTQLSSSLRVQPVITLQTQLPIMSNAQLTSNAKPQIATSSQIPFGSGTKLTLGPHSQVPIIPQAPLTLPQQGLTIAQAGTQLLITTKPVQQSGSSKQPTLLGLGIGTNPAVAPKNIVLLPNILLNSVSSSEGNVNGKQAPAIQRQLILQTTANTSSSLAPVQLQKSNVNCSQSTKNQSHVLMAPLFTVCNNPLSTSSIKTTVSSNVQKPMLSLLSSTPNYISSINTAPASTINSKPVELSNQLDMSLDKFICEICDDSVKDLEKLRRHMKCLHEINIHPKMMPSFNCQKCQFCFFTEQGLERHLVGSHGLVTTGLQEASDKGKDGGRCPICGWGYQNKLLHHVATDHKVCLKPADLSYKCTLCTATFGVYKQFEDHVYSMHRLAISKLAQGNPESSSSAIK